VDKALFTVKLAKHEATVDGVRRKLDLRTDQIDSEFGVVEVDPRQQLYAVMIDDAAIAEGGKAAVARGPFSNPTIEPFGPTRDR
jgi:hypothetical protein